MTVNYKKLDMGAFPRGVLTTTIEGQHEVDGKKVVRAFQLEGDAVVVVTVTEKELLDAKQGVTIIFTGQENLKIFLFNAMLSWCTIEGDLGQMIAHLLRQHPEEYLAAQIEALAINTKEATHDDAEGRTRHPTGGSP